MWCSVCGVGSSFVLAGRLFILVRLSCLGQFRVEKQDSHEKQCPSVLAQSRVAQLEKEQERVRVRRVVAMTCWQPSRN